MGIYAGMVLWWEHPFAHDLETQVHGSINMIPDRYIGPIVKNIDIFEAFLDWTLLSEEDDRAMLFHKETCGGWNDFESELRTIE